MTRKEYDAQVNHLCENAETMEIGQEAKQAAWYLDCFYSCEGETYKAACAAYEKEHCSSLEELYDEDAFQTAVRQGWFRFIGGYLTEWVDGLC